MKNREKRYEWLRKTRIAEAGLRKYLRRFEYMNIGLENVQLDGTFRPYELRMIADIVEERIKAADED